MVSFAFSDATTGRGTHQFRVVSPIRSILWHPGRTTVLTTGLRNGLVLTIQVQRNNFEHSVDGTVHCMAFSHTGKSLAIGFKNQVLILPGATKDISLPSQILKAKPISHAPSSSILRTNWFLLLIYLLESWHMKQKILVFYCWHITAEGRCGESALSASSRLLVVTDPTDGVHWYDTSNQRLASTIQGDLFMDTNVVLPVTFIGSNTIAVGSATGHVSMFQSGSSHPLQVLRHNDEMVQALAYCYIKDKGTHLLVTGTSEQFDECSLNVWTAVDKQKKNTSSFSTFLSVFCCCPDWSHFGCENSANLSARIKKLSLLEYSQQLSQTFPLPWGSKADIHEVTNTATVDYIHTVTKTVETVGKVTKVKALN
ncbi:hypothetical protein C8J57DRAFT_1260130 [Mycena rebaudengoi]|nr:hypothetical protein C8J57DRAFT_1260130 [Mycena rebaudengoi]